MLTSNFNFPCDACGKCCKNLHLSAELDELNRGDGVCKYLNESDNKCTIYEDRPDICRVDVQYQKHFSTKYTWGQFVQINVAVCNELKK